MITNFISLDLNPALVEFRDYCMAFYAPHSDLYPIEGFSEAICEVAIMEYIKQCSDPENDFEWGDGDSIDRERVSWIARNKEYLPLLKRMNPTLEVA